MEQRTFGCGSSWWGIWSQLVGSLDFQCLSGHVDSGQPASVLLTAGLLLKTYSDGAREGEKVPNF